MFFRKLIPISLQAKVADYGIRLLTWAAQYAWYQKVAPMFIRMFKAYQQDPMCHAALAGLLVAIAVVVTACGPIEVFYTAFNIDIVPPIILEILASITLVGIIYHPLLYGAIYALDYLDRLSN